MDNRPRAQSVLQVRSQSRGPEFDKPRTAKLFSSFRGIIRFPHRKSKDDREGNHPYGRRGSSDAGLKPYMSQPTLGLASSNEGRYPHVDRDLEDSSERSTSTDHSPTRNARAGDFPSPITKPHAPSHRQQQHSVSSGLPPAIQSTLTPSKRGNGIDGLPPGAKQPHPVLVADSSTGAAASAASRVKTSSLPSRKLQQQSARPSGEMLPSNVRDTVYNTQKALPPDPSKTIHHPPPPKPDDRSSTSKFQTPACSAATASSITTQMSPDNSAVETPTPKPAFTTPTLLQRSGLNDVSAHPRRQGISAPRLTMPSPSQKFMSMNDGSSARLSPSVVLRPPPLRLQLPTLPPLTPTASPVVEGSHHKQLKSMPALPLQGASRGVRGHEEVDDGEDDDEEEDDETPEADVEEENRLPRSSIDSEASGRGSVLALAPNHAPSRPHSRGSSYYTPGEISLSSKDTDTSTSKALLPEVDTSRIDLSFLDRSVLTGPINGKGKAREEYRTLHTPVAAARPSPSINTNVHATDYFNSRIPAAGDRTPHPGTSYGSALKTPKPGDGASWVPLPSPRVGTGEFPMHPKMYKRVSRSLIDVSTMLKEMNVEMITEEGEQDGDLKGKRMSRGFKEVDVGASPVVAPRTPKADGGEAGAEQQRQKRISGAPAYEIAVAHQLRRRRSMPMFTETSDPPPYPAFPPFPSAPKMRITPREDEGKEKLPPYSNSIYLKAIMPRKMEFSSPGVQAKDRKWYRVICILEGTTFKIYRCPPNVAGVSTIGGWWERTVGVGDVAEDTGIPRKESSKEVERRRDRERAEERETKEQEAREDRLGVSVRLPPSRSASPAPSVTRPLRQHHTQHSQDSLQLPGAATRSALNLAVNLLKPSKMHGRSNSDVPRSPVRPRSPRPSLNLPRASLEGSLSRSHSPGPSPQSSANGHLSAGSFHSSAMRPASPFSSTPATSSSLRSQIRSGQNSARSSMLRDKDHERDEIRDPNSSDLIKQYTLQNAESGLGNDYLKRKNVIRVRMEGEQFLLQAKDVASVVEWIEGLQAATNIALDLDERPMPRGPLFPRRRRRRRAQAAATIATSTEGAAGSGAGNAGETATS